jgi:hypothetical protein
LATQVQTIRFQKEVSGVAGVTQDVALNFTPKAIILYSTGGTTNDIGAAGYQTCIGFSDGTNHTCWTDTSVDNAAAANVANTHRNDSVLVITTPGTPGTTIVRGTCIFQTNNVRFTWAVNNTAGYFIHMMAIGGADITNVKVAAVDAGRNTAGTQDYTGLGFNPSNGTSVLFLVGGTRTTVNASVTSLETSFGCAVSSSKRWAIGNESEHTADPTDTWCVQRDDAVFYTTTLGAVSATADFSAWITDGFRLNWTDAQASTSAKMMYLVINGGTWDCGTTIGSGSAAVNDVNFGVSVNGSTLRGLFMTSTGMVTINTISAESRISYGSTDGTNQSVVGVIDESAGGASDGYKRNNAINIILNITTNGAIISQAVFDSFTTNNFILDFASVGGNLNQAWVVVADTTVVAAAVEEISYQSYGNIHQAFDSNKNMILG